MNSSSNDGYISKTELKNCPFCGYSAKKYIDITTNTILIGCSNKACLGCIGNKEVSESKAIEAWNKRHESDLEKIKNICWLQRGCNPECPFCQINKICLIKNIMPMNWNLDKINNIIEHLNTSALKGEKG